MVWCGGSPNWSRSFIAVVIAMFLIRECVSSEREDVSVVACFLYRGDQITLLEEMALNST